MEQLPAYSPELNPNEYGWSYIKYHKLSNFAPDDVEVLEKEVCGVTEDVRSNTSLLRSFVYATGLSIRL